MAASTAQVLSVSPDSALHHIVQRCVHSLGHDALPAKTVAQARRLLTRVEIDLLCLDSVLPSSGVRDLLRWFDTAREGRTPGLLFFGPPSARLLSAGVPSWLRSRVDGIVTKPVQAVELVRELARVLAGRPSGERRAALLQVEGRVLDGGTQKLFLPDGSAVSLTPTEYRLLRFLMQRNGEFVSTEELLEKVWDYPADSGAELVRAHVSNVRRKFRSAGEDPQLLRNLPYHGYGFLSQGR